MSVGESEFLSVENVHKIKIAVAGVGWSAAKVALFCDAYGIFQSRSQSIRGGA